MSKDILTDYPNGFKPGTNGDGYHPSEGESPNVPGEEKSTGTTSSRIADLLSRIRIPRSDEVVIGSNGHLEPMPQFTTGSMLDARKLVGDLKFLLPAYIPYGMLTELLGEPGKGKSLLLLWMMRSLVMGLDWFNGTKGFGKPRNVLLCDTEGRFAVNMDRLRKWGVPDEAIGRIKTPFEGKEAIKPIDLTNWEHLERIERAINKYETPLVGIDSMRGAHGEDENSSRVSAVLKPVVQIMERTKAACAVVHHSKKLLIDEDISANSSRGSNAILADFISQIAIDQPDPKSDWKRVQILKENLGLKPKPLGFRPSDSGLEFGPAPKRPEKEKKETGKDKAEDWLRVRMKPGQWYPAKDLIEEGEAAGFSHTGTLQRAKTDLKVKTRKQGKHHEWCRDDIKEDDIKESGDNT